MSRDKGHALKRERDETTAESSWSCECGVNFGRRSVHSAREAWRAHKEAHDV